MGKTGNTNLGIQNTGGVETYNITGGNSFTTTETVTSVDGTGTYSFASLTFTAKDVKVGESFQDGGWSQTGTSIIFDPVLTVDGLDITVYGY